MDAALRALNRFGLGARVGERGRVRDPRAWLAAQLSGPPPAIVPPAGAADRQIADAISALREAGQDDDARRSARRRLRDIALSEARAALQTRVTSDRPFLERLVAFWSNHLCISTQGEPFVVPLAGHYERHVVRPHVLGRFADMVLASARHPAMLIYLDNFQSIGPNSPAAARLSRRRNVERGLNENYARELLELHTVGVDGGYTQTDVRELARILTGWTISGLRPSPTRRRRRDTTPEGDVEFAFQEPLHEPGDKTLLGVRYRESGVTEGERAITALCRRPATAAFVSRKLVTHFVSDDRPPGAVDRVTRVFLETDGDLTAVGRALVDLPESWDERHVKLRTPQDLLVATLRALRVTEVNAALFVVLDRLRHPLWGPQSPQGFSDRMANWADPDSLLNRAELARTVSRLVGSRLDPRVLLDVLDLPDNDLVRNLAADTSITADERVALVLAGPAFQWR